MTPETITTELLDELERLEKAATPGPWAWISYGEKCYAFAVVTAFTDDDRQVGGYVNPGDPLDENEANPVVVDHICSSEDQSGGVDMPFIAAARNALPGLIRRIRELENYRARVIASTVDAMPPDCTLITIERLRDLKQQLAEARGEIHTVHHIHEDEERCDCPWCKAHREAAGKDTP